MIIFLAKFYSCGLGLYQVQMEAEKCSDQESQDASQNVACYDKISSFVVESLGAGKRSLKNWIGSPDNQVASHRTIEKHADKKLVVVKAYAVSNPRTVVVHFKDAAVALAAVVAPVGLSFKTPLTDAHTSKFFPFNSNY